MRILKKKLRGLASLAIENIMRILISKLHLYAQLNNNFKLFSTSNLGKYSKPKFITDLNLTKKFLIEQN